MNSSITSLSPTPRYGKHGWYGQFQKHNLRLNNSKAKILLVGDSLVSNLSRYPKIWRKYFMNHGALNFGIAGDKAQNVLWRVNNFHFSSNLNLKYVFILCGTNNIDCNSPQSIASTIISTGLAFQKKSHKIHVVIKPLLPRDHKHSRRRGIINTVNKLLKFQCLNNGFHFLEFKSNWLHNDDSLNIELFYDDGLHLIRKGNELLAKEIINFYYHTKSILKTFKSFYSNMAGNLLAKLPKSPNRYTIKFISYYYKKLSLSENFKLDATTEGYLFNILKNVEVNLSMTLGSFPDACKIAKVKPLFKKGSKTDPSNYRPISLLPLLPKVFERVVLNQTEEFLSLNKVLYDYQSGFRKNHSTDTCLSFLNDKILKGFDDGLLTGMILIDLQKAFDTINHDILLKKLSIIGFSDHTVKWFQSYLSNRKFTVNLENSFSEVSNISCGVPQ